MRGAYGALVCGAYGALVCGAYGALVCGALVCGSCGAPVRGSFGDRTGVAPLGANVPELIDGPGTIAAELVDGLAVTCVGPAVGTYVELDTDMGGGVSSRVSCGKTGAAGDSNERSRGRRFSGPSPGNAVGMDDSLVTN